MGSSARAFPAPDLARASVNRSATRSASRSYWSPGPSTVSFGRTVAPPSGGGSDDAWPSSSAPRHSSQSSALPCRRRRRHRGHTRSPAFCSPGSRWVDDRGVPAFAGEPPCRGFAIRNWIAVLPPTRATVSLRRWAPSRPWWPCRSSPGLSCVRSSSRCVRSDVARLMVTVVVAVSGVGSTGTATDLNRTPPQPTDHLRPEPVSIANITARTRWDATSLDGGGELWCRSGPGGATFGRSAGPTNYDVRAYLEYSPGRPRYSLANPIACSTYSSSPRAWLLRSRSASIRSRISVIRYSRTYR